jgi:AcrR family transcriptional regulator
VHHPLITYHFSNKDRLWRSAVRYVFADFVSALREAQQLHANDCPKEQFASMIRIYVRYAAANPALHKIVLQESGHESPRLEWLSENFLNPLAAAAAGYIEELQKRGVTPAGDPYIIYNMIRVSSGTLIALALELKKTSNIDIEAEAKLDELADLIIRVFLPGEIDES